MNSIFSEVRAAVHFFTIWTTNLNSSPFLIKRGVVRCFYFHPRPVEFNWNYVVCVARTEQEFYVCCL